MIAFLEIRMAVVEKTALVTGSSSGIGRAIALKLASVGVNVAVNYLTNRRAAAAVANAIHRLGRDSIAVRGDVTKESEVVRMVERVTNHFDELHILVNNVGHWTTRSVEDMSLREWRDVLDSNLTATYLCSKHAIPHMQKARWGRIVNVGCAGAYRAHGAAKMSAFYAAKAGIVAFSKALAREVGQYGITVNVISPGIVPDTSASLKDVQRRRVSNTAVGRPASSDDVSNAVLYLISEEAGFVTGDVLNVTGGWLI